MRGLRLALVAVVVLLVSIGMIMLASASSVKGAGSKFGHNPAYFVLRQLLWLVASFVVMWVLARCDYHWWRKRRFVLVGACCLLVGLVLVFVPGIGGRISGSHRWLRVGPLSVQPSEFAKLAILVFMAGWLADIGRQADRGVRQWRTVCKQVGPPLLAFGLTLGLILAEPDFGTMALTGAVGMAILFVAGARFWYLSLLGAGGVALFAGMVYLNPVRLMRIFAFLFPSKYPDAAYQLKQSKIAFICGDWFGVGLGHSMQKQLYLPEAHTDFIFAILGEELGFVATLVVASLFAAFLILGMRISLAAKDRYGQLLGFAITLMIALQATINIGVVVGWLPTKGLALPFISYGGSALLVALMGVGILLNISLHADSLWEDDHTRVFRDRTHTFHE